MLNFSRLRAARCELSEEDRALENQAIGRAARTLAAEYRSERWFVDVKIDVDPLNEVKCLVLNVTSLRNVDARRLPCNWPVGDWLGGFPVVIREKQGQSKVVTLVRQA